MGKVQLSAFKEASIQTIRGFACPDHTNDSSCSAKITYLCGSESRRELSFHRFFQSAVAWQLEYEVTNAFTVEKQ
jgi:hypothetical protein